VVDASAVQLCARKVAAGSGDVRKALNVCRRAVELVHSAQRKQGLLAFILTHFVGDRNKYVVVIFVQQVQ
jgi:Cdc6-like AAA superfamily ATPase